MKIKVEVDCTPEEAREFLGLPDLRPLQASVMGAMEKQVMAAANRFSPESLLKSWMPLMQPNAEQMMSMFGGLFRAPVGAKEKASE